MSKEIKRREFLQKIFISGIAVTGAGTFLIGCNKDNKPAKVETGKENNKENETSNDSNGPCSDTSGLNSEQLQVRKAYQYVEKSDRADQVCSNCNYWQGLKGGGPCGSCQVVPGSINPKGHCTVWMAKTS